MTQPCERRTGASTGAALTRQREPGAGCRVAVPPSRLMVQCSDRILQINTKLIYITMQCSEPLHAIHCTDTGIPT